MDIAPDKQNVDRVFSNITYFIDFYQRDYKWTNEPVLRLIEDILYVFEGPYRQYAELDPGGETVAAKYPWYYLSTYVTNTVDGRVYIVDGQQRLTTLTLILLKLYHLALAQESELVDWLKSKIHGTDGFQKRFWMHHDGHLDTLKALFDGSDSVPIESGVTAANLATNYKSVSTILNERLSTKHKLETFVFYLLHRVVLINLSVAQTDVPMVFEVINDRGVRLRPYEILKGKLLGQIDKLELQQSDYHGLWEQCVENVNRFKEEEIDEFFIYFLKAKLSNSRNTAERFDNDYHRELFKKDVNDHFKLDHSPAAVKEFLRTSFRYYTSLYAKIWEFSEVRRPESEHVYFNRLNGMDTQFLLILSVCTVDDPHEAEKIRLVSFCLDRLFTTLQLQRGYDSNEFADAIYSISSSIRNADVAAIAPAFERHLLSLLTSRRGVEVSASFEYSQFKNTSIADVPTRFARYFFARVDDFLARQMRVNPKHEIDELVTKTGAKTGFHIEHIISRNDENLLLYESDAERFEIDRNRLGAVLLLKGKDNISSSNESSAQKLESYSGTLHWNETLRADAYKSKLDFTRMISSRGLSFEPCHTYGPNEVEKRQRLLFDLASIVWSYDAISEQSHQMVYA